MNDHMSHGGALELAKRLRAFWLDHGFNISTRVEAVHIPYGRVEVWSVRSNLVSGLPPADARVEVVKEAA